MVVTILYWGNPVAPPLEDLTANSIQGAVAADTKISLLSDFYAALARDNIPCTSFEEFIQTKSGTYTAQNIYLEIYTIPTA
jgi:hypothetical protein